MERWLWSARGASRWMVLRQGLLVAVDHPELGQGFAL